MRTKADLERRIDVMHHEAQNLAGEIKRLRDALHTIKNQYIADDWTHEQAFNFIKDFAKSALTGKGE